MRPHFGCCVEKSEHRDLGRSACVILVRRQFDVAGYRYGVRVLQRCAPERGCFRRLYERPRGSFDGLALAIEHHHDSVDAIVMALQIHHDLVHALALVPGRDQDFVDPFVLFFTVQSQVLNGLG